MTGRRPLTEADTIKAPLAAPPVPLVISARNGASHWNRDELFAAGALTLGELLSHVPGVTLMTTGFLLAPSIVAWHGDPAGVRIFLDGIEREEMTIRNAGVTDYALIPVWALEEISLEEAAGELRVHAVTWRVDRTTPSTRTDVLTGSENLNLFRGYFGRRASNGAVIQLAAQQVSTISVPGLDGDALGAMGRIGWAGGSWSVDGTVLRQGLKRNVGARFLLTDSPNGNALPAYEGSTSTSYLRIGWKNPQSPGAWAQFVAATLGSALKQPAGVSGVAADSGDTTASQAQYVAQAGVNRGRLRLNAVTRVRSLGGTTDVAPLGRAEFVVPKASVSASAGKRFSGESVWDVRAQAAPRNWFRVAATTGTYKPSGASATRMASSIDASVRVRGRWIGGGVRRVDAGRVSGPVEFDSAAQAVDIPKGSALTVSAGGPVWRNWNVQTNVVQWDAATPFRPQTEVRTKFWFASDFRERFPNSTFEVMAALNHEFRSRLFVPNGTDPIGQVSKAYSVFGTLLEIRIASAVISWDYRNMVGLNYETFPGYVMPKIASVYGIRWQFWN
ncbi:MAG: Plug domain-containing protein [Gemmatimonadetes bacterium]|nr:Plug domain-containing protein [Gemmatimonadota bacterium]